MLRTWGRAKIVGLALTWLAAVAVVAVLMAVGRQAALKRGEDDTAAFSIVVTQLVERTFQAFYLTLSSVADAHEVIRPEKNNQEYQRLMRRGLEDIPFSRALFIIGPDGWITHDTDYPATPNLSLADRSYFLNYAEANGRARTVWPPVLSRSGTGWFLPVTDALNRSGGFVGVVVAALQADRFSDELRRAGLGPSHFIALFHHEVKGSSATEALKISSGRGGQLAIRVPTPHLGLRCGIGKHAPLTVLVSVSQNDVLAVWRRLAAAAAFAMFGLTAALVWQAARFAREHGRREHERERQTQIEKLEALGQLTGGIAHDFANVLHIVAMNLDLLRLGRGDSATERAFANAERAVRNGTSMVERLLSFARRKPLTLSRLRLDKWLEAAQPLLARAAGAGMTLEIDSDESVPEVLCDADELDMALLNLVVNARHATSGSGRVSMRVQFCNEGSPGVPSRFAATPTRFVCLTVTDDGCGMTEEVKRRAVEPFFSTKGEAGTGLGLSQVYGLMQQVGGGVTIASSPGRGTTVNLYIPVAPQTGSSRSTSS